MKILIVDDEPLVASAVGRVLRVAGKPPWRMTTATSGREALTLLEAEGADIVISDMRMPEMDGAALLSAVRTRWPDTVRVVLSGYAEPGMAERVASVAHHFYEKPVAAAELVAGLKSIEQRRRELPPSVLRDLIGGAGDLPGAPHVYLELSMAMNDDRVHVDALVEIVRRAPNLAAKVLHLGGSTFFTRSAPTHDLRSAVQRLGIRLIAAMALAASALHVDPSSGLDQETMTSKAIAAAARAQRAVTDPALAEDAFIAALLADVGLAALGCWAPRRVREVHELAARSRVSITVAELELLGVTHAALGAYLLGIWRLPEQIVQAVTSHHAEAQADLPSELARAVWEAHMATDVSTS